MKANEFETKDTIDTINKEIIRIREENTKLWQIIEFLPDATFVIDHQHRVTHWNKAAEKMTGVSKDAILGNPDYSTPFYQTSRPILVDLLDTDEHTVKDKYDYIRRDGMVINAETFIPTFNNGSGAYLWIAASPLFDSNGKRIGAIEVVRDITEHRILEDSLQKKEDRFQQLVKNIDEVFFILDAGTRSIIYASPATESVIGIPASRVIQMGIELTSIIHKEDRPHVAFADENKRYTTSINEEFRIIRPDGSITWIRLRTFPIKNNEGEIKRVVGIASNISIYKQAEEKERLHQLQLLQTEKMARLGILVSGIAHEINNPNNYITLSIPLLKQVCEACMPVFEQMYKNSQPLPLGASDMESLKSNVDNLIGSIKDGATRIKNIVSELKEYARTDPLEKSSRVDINEVVKVAVNPIRSYIKKHTDNFSLTLSPDTPVIWGRFQRIEQVVINLLQNACDSLDNQGKGISLITNVTGEGSITITVSDEGCGIPEEHKNHVLDPFFTTKRESGGTGLGLSVTASIIREHKGTIRFESKAGKGTTVIVTFPKCDSL
ncbi:MAG: PAS domain S-box protein [Chitinispirillaceae bacterium]|nr:PAS domain S-box protein [Chitinispirillaceae bacterium]